MEKFKGIFHFKVMVKEFLLLNRYQREAFATKIP